MSTWNSILRMYGSVLKNGVYTYQEIASNYVPRLNKHKAKVMEVAKAGSDRVLGSQVAQNVRTAYLYAKVELSPPNFNEKQKAKDDLNLIKKFIGSNCWKEMTVKQAWLLFLVGLEIMFWFFMGECIGKLRIVGYNP